MAEGVPYVVEALFAGGSQLRTIGGILDKIAVGDAGTAWIVDVYDTNAANSVGKIFTYKTASGGGTFDLSVHCKSGLRVISNGTTAGLMTLSFK